MGIEINNINVNYVQYGRGKKDIVLLHGWGQNIEMMKPLGNNLQDKFKITIIDFPGFGESDTLKEIWDIATYKEMLKELLSKLKIDNPILIGHSFGGRVAIKYAAEEEIDKLVLFGAPCVRKKKVSIKEMILKTIKKLPGMNKIGEYAKKYIGSTDYRNASPIMRQTLVNVVNEDLSISASKINVPTLLIWGTLDTEAPIEDAKKLEELLSDGALIELEGRTHYAYLEALSQVINILESFL